MSLMPEIVRKGIVRDSYSVAPATGFMRTEMEVGPARQRRIATAMPTNVSFTIYLNRKGLAVFEAWYKHTLQNGAAWFSMPIESGTGYNWTDTRFTDAYSVSIVGYDAFEVSCSVECRELPVMDESDLEKYLNE